MQLVVRPEAVAELLAAQAWYEQRSPGLGFEFARAVDAAVARAVRAPLAFPRIEADFRHVIARNFPTRSFITRPNQSWLWFRSSTTDAGPARGCKTFAADERSASRDFLTVSHIDERDNIRIISARLGAKAERKFYEEG